ncbi:putative DNA polymerase [Aeromonas phage CF8]|nr:putative DNA polymerase [Aeromonas phage CF8]
MSAATPFLSENYESDRNIIKHTITQYALVVSRIQNLPFEQVREDLIKYFKANKDQFKSKRAKVIVKNKVQDREVKVLPLSSVLKHVQDKNYHFSPSMIAYTHSDEEECVNAIGTRDFLANRKHYKDLRQDAKAAGNKDLYIKYNELQNAFKIFNNAQSGAMSSEGTPINNKTGHTTLTSTCRSLTSTANLINEQFIAGNRFYNTPENTMQALAARLQITNFNKVQQVMEKFNLYYPTPEEVLELVERSSRRYWESDSTMKYIKTFLEKLRPVELATLAYTLDLITLYKYNRTFMNGFFDDYVHIPPFEEGKPGLKPDNGDKYVLAISKLPRDPSKEAINQLNEYHMQIEEKYFDLLNTFFKSQIPPSGLFDVISAVRDCVLTSDTDSSIVTVDALVDDYTDDPTKGIRLNGVITYFVRMISLDQHAQLSANMNVSKRNLHMLQMKNEFLFGSYVTTNMSKHYYASQLMVEGVTNKEPEIEIKGVHLKSSKIAPRIKDKAQELMYSTMGSVENKKKMDPAQILHEIAELERDVINEIKTGGWSWLSRESIKNASAYTNPFSEKYMYHDMWEQCFAHKYGPAPELPYIGVKMSVDMGSKTKLKAWVDSIEDEEIKLKLTDWLIEKSKDKLSNLYVPREILQNLGDIPVEFKQAIDYRTIIKQNFKSIYEVLHSTGIYVMNDNITRLISDEH